MPFKTVDLQKAMISLEQFKTYTMSPHHERYSFPFLCGTYFTYRKVDVLRLISISKAVAKNGKPRYLDVGCGNGDFLSKIRAFLPNAVGIDNDARIFYYYRSVKPDYIKIADARWGIDHQFDIIFVGWMEPGIDFRDAVAAKADVIVTTLDQGISLAAEFEGNGFERIAKWRTPSWEDVNTEIMNRYYTKMSNKNYSFLSKLRGAHNLWYVYSSKHSKSEVIKSILMQRLEDEKKDVCERYDFEDVLDECGFRYLEQLQNLSSYVEIKERLWDIHFNNI
ncbi:MAG TPA: class I SAM-dependent methyltransferase [Nitrososphaeraceae archaeon]|jgi:SAM-dependent methyltransferase|nr:class I SAM-dependent methyltransferase [Nitrososphaeraceae archaeon]